MPIVKISVLKGKSREEKRRLHEAIHGSLVSVLNIESWDFFHSLLEFEKEDFLFPDFKSEKFLLLEIHLFPGRSDEKKAEL